MNETPEDGQIIAITGSSFGAGHYQIVAINLGTDDGVESGHTFSAFRPGKTVRDSRYPLMSRAAFKEPEKRHVVLLDEFVGRIMVFCQFDIVSFAIVLVGSMCSSMVDTILAY